MATPRMDRTAEMHAAPAPAGLAERARVLETWVDEHGPYLYRYAVPRVGDAHLAEEVVQETFLAALQSLGSFRRDASPRTWLVGLMRRKIADHYRRRRLRREAAALDAADPAIEAWFDQRGSWVRPPGRFEVRPAELQQQADFWEVFDRCLQVLPEGLAEAFSLRVLHGVSAAEVRKVLAVTSTNLWVMLHRARARLRACLEKTWFESEVAAQR